MPVPRPKSAADLPLRICFAAALAAVTWLSLAAGNPQPSPGISDKLKHVGAYAFLGVLGLLAHPSRRAGVAAFLFGWGILMEIAQGFVPRRTPELADTVANLLGILLAWGLVRIGRGRIPVPTE